MKKTSLVVVAVLCMAAAAPMLTPTAAQTGTRVLTITSPAAPMVPAGDLTVRGTLGSTSAGRSVVLFAVDQSGSTSSPRQDCSGDALIDTNDDLNGDGSSGDVLDCEIAAVVSMLTSIAGRGDIDVGLIGYGSSAAAADLASDDGVQNLVPAGADGNDGGDRDRLPDLISVASSLRRGTIEAFTRYQVGTGTSFTAPLATADQVFAAEEQRRGTSEFNKVVLFLSDGEASISADSPVLASLAGRNATVNTYAVGTGAGGCSATDPLGTISSALRGACTPVADPSTLSAAIGGTSVDPVSVTLRNTANGNVYGTIDTTTNALGEYTATVQGVPPGRFEIVVRSAGQEARRVVSVRQRGASLVYAALGDSYSSGEGAQPWRNEERSAPTTDPFDDECHRSVRGYPMQVRAPGQASPLARSAGSSALFGFGACAGAITQNILYNPQIAGGLQIPLQIGYLNDQTDLVTATIGGNDIEFSQIAMHCITQFNCQARDGRGSDVFVTLGSGRTLTLPQYADLRLAILAAQMPNTYLRMKEATDYTATIVVAGYPELFQPKPSVLCATRSVITREEREYLADAASRFNRLLSAATARAGVFYRPVIDEFRPHLPCGNQEQWLGGIATGITDKGKKLHPTVAGYTAYANLISGSLDEWAANPPRGLKPNGLPHNPAPNAPANPQLRLAATGTAALDDGWVDESADPAPAMNTDVLPGVAVDGLDVDETGAVVFDPWLADVLPDLPSITLDDLRSVADAAEPDLTLTSDSAPDCIDTAAVGSEVTATASGFAPGATVTLRSDTGRELARATSDAAGVATFTTNVDGPSAAFIASGPTDTIELHSAAAVVNPVEGNPCVATAETPDPPSQTPEAPGSPTDSEPATPPPATNSEAADATLERDTTPRGGPAAAAIALAGADPQVLLIVGAVLLGTGMAVVGLLSDGGRRRRLR